jgi:hypothetical protein
MNARASAKVAIGPPPRTVTGHASLRSQFAGSLAFVPNLFSYEEMPKSDNEPLRFVIKMALRNAFRVIAGLRKQINEMDEDVMTIKFIQEIEMSNYQITKKSGASGHTFEAPKGPRE